MTEERTMPVAAPAPTWVSLLPFLVVAAAKGDKPAMLELNKLARIVDEHIARLNALGAASYGIMAEGPDVEAHADGPPDVFRDCPDCGVHGGHAYGCPLAT